MTPTKAFNLDFYKQIVEHNAQQMVVLSNEYTITQLPYPN